MGVVLTIIGHIPAAAFYQENLIFNRSKKLLMRELLYFKLKLQTNHKLYIL